MTYTIDKTREIYNNPDLAEILLDNHKIEEELYKYLTESTTSLNTSICAFKERSEIHKKLLTVEEEKISYFHGVMNNLQKNSDIEGFKTLRAYRENLTKDEAAELITSDLSIPEIKNARVSKEKIRKLAEEGKSIGEIIQETGADGKRVNKLL